MARSIRPAAACSATTAQAISVSSVHSHGALHAGSAPGPAGVGARAALRALPGYGPGPVTVLRLIHTGTPQPVATASAFDRQGSRGWLTTPA
ncbi:hypothetical protein FHU28_003652 [Micromonospora echinospora]|uniref:Uncharacterized protein n=1 Tax=Micromonospora echinospora TaxID=1877 RepID=A0ABR6MEK7_MICEC|nr:hypothetical protein [Micromonospora echinospora]